MLNTLNDWLYGFIQSPSINWKLVLISGSFLNLGFRTLLDLREYLVQSKISPPELAVKENNSSDVLDRAFQDAQAYKKTQLKFESVKRIYKFALNVFIIGKEFLPRLWEFWLPIVSSTRLGGGAMAAGLLTMITVDAIKWIVAALPFEYYETFVIEEKFGKNRLTRRLWIRNATMVSVLYLVFIPPIVLGLASAAECFHEKLVLCMSLFYVGLSIVSSYVIPSLISPLFNKYIALEHGELRTAIENLASASNFCLQNTYIIDGSERSAHSSACIIGLPQRKQIVLCGTLTSGCKTEEVTAVLAHELGHWKHHHLIIDIITGALTQVPISISLLAFLRNARLFESLGFASGVMPTVIALYIYDDALAPINTAVQFIRNYVSRLCEYDADKYAAKLGKGKDLYSALIKLSNLAEVDSDPIYSTLYDNQPRFIDRLKALRAEIAKVH